VTEKQHIITNLGEDSLLLPALVNAALAANDRSKYYFALLQTAKSHAEHPDSDAPSLRHERVSSGVGDETLDEVVGASVRAGEGRYRIPGAACILRALFQDVNAMLRPFGAEAQAGFAPRLEALKARVPAAADNVLLAGDIDAMTSANRGQGDSLHMLIMDMHKALNALQATIAPETIDGASVYGIDPGDRDPVRAFMRGLKRTAPLKFDHPGLGTTATRSDGRLVLQNDIGTTDAHVLVVHVEGLQVTLTYTDVHLQRLLFFQSLFERYNVDWEDTRSRKDDAFEDGVYHLCLGNYSARDETDRNQYLEFLGSRLVYLIDWNRARKRLRLFVSKGEAIRLLRWAAENDHGHMAFLKAGGEQLIYDALDFVVKGQARFGEQLHEILGASEATEYLKSVLRTCAETLLLGEPESFIQDTVRAELFNYFRTGRQRLYDIISEHAALIVEIASGIRDSLLQARSADFTEQLARNSERAKAWEHRADELVNRARDAAKHAESSEFFRAIVEAADDVADELEDAAFHLTLLASSPQRPTLYEKLHTLGDLLVQGAQEYLKAVETARHVRRGGAREDTQDFLEAIHRIMQMERRTDEAQRGVKIALARGADGFRELYVLTETAKNLEQAADGLMHCGLRTRDYILGQVMAA
jgi:uncharacterized protein Yka (UPF0111/DUF47 family)